MAEQVEELIEVTPKLVSPVVELFQDSASLPAIASNMQSCNTDISPLQPNNRIQTRKKGWWQYVALVGIYAAVFATLWILQLPPIRYARDHFIALQEATTPNVPDMPSESQLEEQLKTIKNKQTHLFTIKKGPNYSDYNDIIESAHRGEAEGEFHLARSYEVGRHGLPIAIPEALKWYGLAVAHGSPMALYDLGVLYFNGAPGVEKNVQKACELWIRGSAMPGSTTGIGMCTAALGHCAADKGEYKIAAEAYAKALEQGDSRAAADLASMYALGRGVKQSWAEASRLAQLVPKNDKENLSMLAWILREKLVVAQNSEIIEWNVCAAKCGDNDARYFLIATRADHNAVVWRRELFVDTDEGSASAQFNLGQIYLQSGDQEMAASLYVEAAANGSARAAYELGVACVQDGEAAGSRKFFELISHGDKKEAEFFLGQLCEDQQFHAKAIKHYEQAVQLGSYEAERRLLELDQESHDQN